LTIQHTFRVPNVNRRSSSHKSNCRCSSQVEHMYNYWYVLTECTEDLP